MPAYEHAARSFVVIFVVIGIAVIVYGVLVEHLKRAVVGKIVHGDYHLGVCCGHREIQGIEVARRLGKIELGVIGYCIFSALFSRAYDIVYSAVLLVDLTARHGLGARIRVVVTREYYVEPCLINERGNELMRILATTYLVGIIGWPVESKHLPNGIAFSSILLYPLDSLSHIFYIVAIYNRNINIAICHRIVVCRRRKVHNCGIHAVNTAAVFMITEYMNKINIAEIFGEY